MLLSLSMSAFSLLFCEPQSCVCVYAPYRFHRNSFEMLAWTTICCSAAVIVVLTPNSLTVPPSTLAGKLPLPASLSPLCLHCPESLLLPAATRQQQTNLARTPSSERPKKRPTDPDKVAQRCFTTQSCCYNLLITFYHLYVSARLFVQSLLIFPPPPSRLCPRQTLAFGPKVNCCPFFRATVYV